MVESEGLARHKLALTQFIYVLNAPEVRHIGNDHVSLMTLEIREITAIRNRLNNVRDPLSPVRNFCVQFWNFLKLFRPRIFLGFFLGGLNDHLSNLNGW